MEIVFSTHAEQKFALLKTRGFPVNRQQVLECVTKPDRIEPGYMGRCIAQRHFDSTHVLRVVFLDQENVRKIITFYPARGERYEAEL